MAEPDDLFSNPPRPTGFPPGADPAAVEATDLNQATPAEQAQYTQIVKKAAQVIYGSPRVALKAINDPRVPIYKAVGQFAAQLGMQIEQSARVAGDKLEPDVMFHAGAEVIAMLLDLGIQAKIFNIDPESDKYQKIAGMALMEAEKVFGERLLADPQKGPLATDEAGTIFARGIAEEVDAGSVNPDFMSQIREAQANGSPIGRAVRASLFKGA